MSIKLPGKDRMTPYLACLAIMFISNLGYPKMVQYMTRGFGIAASWYCLLYCGRGTLKVKSIRHEPTLLLVMHVGICALSCFWSIMPVQSGMKVAELFTDFMLLQRMARGENRDSTAKRTMDLYMTICMVLLAITLVGFFVVPSYFANRRYSARQSLLGVRLGEGFLGANKASALSAMCICWLVLLRPWQGLRSAAGVGMCVIIMFLSQSRASLIMLPVIVVFRFFRYREKYRALYILAGVAVLGLMLYKMDLIIAYIMRGQTAEALKSGSGRTTVWTYAMEFIAKRPLFGYGFGAGGELASYQYHGLETVHSGIFEILLGTGCVGLVIVLLQYFYAARILVTNVMRQGLRANFMDALFMLYYLIRTVTSLGIANWHSPEIMIWWLYLFAIQEGRGLQRIYREQNEREASAVARENAILPVWITELEGGAKENG